MQATVLASTSFPLFSPWKVVVLDEHGFQVPFQTRISPILHTSHEQTLSCLSKTEGSVAANKWDQGRGFGIAHPSSPMTSMTSMYMNSSPHKFPGIKHKCLRRKSRRTYELLDPKRPGEAVAFDIGQVREIVLMDKRLREEGVVRSVPAGYTEFAQRFNQYTAGRERFATYSFVNGRYLIHKEGSPIVWEDFLIDDSLVVSNADFVESPSFEASSSQATGKGGDWKSTSGADLNSIKLHQLSARMKEAMKTTDALGEFWLRRGAVEHEYASRLAKLSETQFGGNEPAELRSAIDALRMETAKQAMNRHELAKQFAVDLESRCVNLHLKQCSHWNEIYEPTARRLQKSLSPDSPQTDGVSVEWKKEYDNMRHPIDALRREAMQRNEHATGLSRRDSFDDLFAKPSNASNLAPGWANEWTSLRSSCERLEADRSQFMQGLLTAYADALGTIRVAQDESYNAINLSLDLFRPQDVVDDFIQKFGGNEVIVENCDTHHAPTHSTLNPLRAANVKITGPSTSSSARGPLPTPSIKIEPVRRSRVRTSMIAEDGPQPNFDNGDFVIDNKRSNNVGGLERGKSLRTQGERQYPRNSSRPVGTPDPTAPVATRLRPASFYSKINTFWRPTPTPEPQHSLTNTGSQRRPILEIKTAFQKGRLS